MALLSDAKPNFFSWTLGRVFSRLSASPFFVVGSTLDFTLQFFTMTSSTIAKS